MSTLSDVLQFVGLLGGDPAEMQAAKDRREAEMQLAKSLSSDKYFADTIRQGLLSEVPMPPERPGKVPMPPKRPESLLPEVKPVEQVQDILSSKFSPQVTAALMGNIAVETGDSFDYAQEQYEGGPGRGLFQMEGKMLDAYNKYLGDNNIQNSAQAQIDFMENILTSGDVYDIGAGHRRAMKKVFESGNIPTITREFSERVLRPGKPHINKRLQRTYRHTPSGLL